MDLLGLLQGLNFDRTLVWIILLPLFGAIINGLAGRYVERKWVTAVALGSVAAAFLLAVGHFLHLRALHAESEESARIVYDAFEWFRVTVPTFAERGVGYQSVPINVRFVMDELSGLMTLVVTGIGFLIHLYSVGYMEHDPSYARFLAYLNLFTASMLILVLGSSLPIMFVGWEGVGLCSYLLIGFWYQNPDYAAAGRKAFVVNRVGDFGVIVGMFLLFMATKSFEFSEINARSGSLAADAGSLFMGGGHWGLSIAGVACVFFFLGCAGKSAQLPLFVWLPDAMAGPTPVSALIHAATMVTAGVYLCCRLSAVFVLSPAAMAMIAIVGTLTALMAASIALVQTQLKKVLAYSTVSQLGFMFAAVGVGAFGAGFFHVFTHAFFKACLFLGAGSVMHAVNAHGDADFMKLGGLKKWMPITRMTFLLSCLAIAGFPLLSGFFSKDEILLAAATSSHFFTFAPWLGYVITALLLFTATLTAFYMFRLYFLTFEGEFRGGESHGHDDHGHHEHHDPHESPWPMWVPLVVLAVGAVFAGYLGMPHAFHLPNWWGHWLDPVLATAGQGEHEVSAKVAGGVMALGTLAGLIGIGMAYVIYMQKGGEPARALRDSWPRLHSFLMDKWRVDELYAVIILKPMHAIADFSSGIDKAFVDGLLTRLPPIALQVSSYLVTRLQNGVVYTYGAFVVVGGVLLSWWFVSPHASVETAVQGDQVRLVAGRGLGYEYRWDYDSDGKFDTAWSAERFDVTHRYEENDYRGATLRFVESLRNLKTDVTVDSAQPIVLSSAVLGRNWAKKSSTRITPAVRYSARRHAVWIRGNDAALGLRKPEESVSMGRTLNVGLGEVQLHVLPIVESTLEVRNAFGAVGRKTVRMTLDVAASEGEGETAMLRLDAAAEEGVR